MGDRTEAPQSIEGNVAAAKTDTGDPVKIGGLAKTANPTPVSDGQRVNDLRDKMGRVVTRAGHVRELVVAPTVVTITSTTETTILAAGGASVFHDPFAIIVNNTSGTAVRVDIRDDTAGTIRFTVYVPAGDVRGISFGGRSIPQTSANDNWTAQLSAAVTDVRITVFAEKNL